MAEPPTTTWPLTRRFEDALAYAARAHRGQYRKGTTIPYVSHLLAACATVLEDGGDEDEAIAALLHDAVEDAGGKERAVAIRQRFGDRVARIVEECSDTDEDPKPAWLDRKRAHVEHAKTAADDVRRVSLADKIHNARSIVSDYRDLGEELWPGFTTGNGDDQVWYFDSLVAAFRRPGDNRLVEELARIVEELKALRAARTESRG